MPQTSSAPPTDLQITWHTLSSDKVVESIGASPQSGLSSTEAARRLEAFGLNQLAEKPHTSFFRLVVNQLNNFIIYLLMAAALISLLLGDWIEAIAILIIVVLNATLGVVQESRAEKSLAALKKMAAPEAQVLRDGRRVAIPSPQLVPGDIVFLEAGNFVPADMRLLEAVNLKVEEASLTGESAPVGKDAALVLQEDIPIGDRRNTVFMGTTITYGRGHGVVVGTGMRTQLGLIADMLQSVDDEITPLQRRLDNLGKMLGWSALVVVALVFIIGLWRILSRGGEIKEIIDMFMIAVSLAIAAVPEGLMAVVTISLAMGMQEMVRRHALIRRLSSVETLGSATVICTDKTGTITQNEMTVTRLWVDNHTFEISGSGYDPLGEFSLNGKPADLKQYPAALTTLWVGMLNNDARIEQMPDDEQNYRIIGDPTEGSILIAALKAGASIEEIKRAYPRHNEIPFDSGRKRMTTLNFIERPLSADPSPLADEDKKSWYAVAVKGAPDVVLDLCSTYQKIDDTLQPLDAEGRALILAGNDTMTRQALRVLGLAYAFIPQHPGEIVPEALEKDLVFAGMVGMIDPPREEIKPALLKARRAGIRTIMITGDYPNTARAIADSVGLLRKNHIVMTGAEINELDDVDLRHEAQRTDVFARVSPEHKMRIVDALRANGEVVAMTGDGVNDAPAIKRADIGVAMGITGTDVAKETADMVLTDDNYASIVAAIEQGRIIYSNIRKFVYYLLSCNLAEIATIFLATLFGWPSPLTALQILWINLITDGAPALALATEKGDPDIMDHPPRPAKEPIINNHMRIGIIAQTLAITSATLAAFFIGLNLSHTHAQTMAFVTLSISELLRAFTARSEYFPLTRIGIFTNKWMNLATLASVALILVAVYVPFLNEVFATEPLGLSQWLQILPLVLLPSLTAEITKLFLKAKKVQPPAPG